MELRGPRVSSPAWGRPSCGGSWQAGSGNLPRRHRPDTTSTMAAVSVATSSLPMIKGGMV
jgi:hypothetical protein